MIYSPLFPSELHVDLIDILKKCKSVCFYGDYGCGKTESVMTTLKFLDYEITYINEYNENIKETLNKVNNVMSFFLNKKYVIVLDDYPFTDIDLSNKFIIYITNKKLNKIESINIPNPDSIFLNLLAFNVLYLENHNFVFNSMHINFRTFWSDLNFSMQMGEQINSDFFFKPNDKEYIKLLSDKKLNLNEKIIASENIHSYIQIQNKIINKIHNIDNLADALEYMSCAVQGTPEYGILSIVAPSLFIYKK